MANLQVSDTNVPTLLKRLKSGEYLSPRFQRDFVWSTAAVISLINSIIDAKPIGMITLWEQEDDSQLDLEHISINDWNTKINKTAPKYFGENTDRSGRYYAILDGRQRSTAIALAFGGLRAQSGLYKTAGRYFLDVNSKDDAERVRFIQEKEVDTKGLDKLNVAIGAGLFPLEVNDPDNIYATWMDYIQNIGDSKFYPENKLPSAEELSRRNKILRNAFDGIINTKIAIYTVPRSYALGEICEIFETLNTTGTKVSTVDLIHSWVYADTVDDTEGPRLLRQWIDELGELDGAVGWASSRDRPELIAQFVAASYIAADVKDDPRPMTGSQRTRITSVKAQDLLAIPTTFWKSIFSEQEVFARIIGEFQECVSGGRFSMKDCPYPASAAIYIGLRWHQEFDAGPDVFWSRKHLDSLYRAFFWRNVLLHRYDQGFLTQIGADLNNIRKFLDETGADDSFNKWCVRANDWLDDYLEYDEFRPTINEIITDGNYSGALRKASLLLLKARATNDPVDRDLDISIGASGVNMHHIYPRDWCKNNVTEELEHLLDQEKAESDWVNSAVNLIPMHRDTNLKWRKQLPSQFINANKINYGDSSDLWESYFVSKKAFGLLKSGAQGIEEFWREREILIGDEMQRLTLVS